MAQGKRRTRLARRPRKDWDEILAVTLNQRRHDAAGNRLPLHDLAEIAAMTPEQRAEVKAKGWLRTPEGRTAWARM